MLLVRDKRGDKADNISTERLGRGSRGAKRRHLGCKHIDVSDVAAKE
jgi:hypothetical protein